MLKNSILLIFIWLVSIQGFAQTIYQTSSTQISFFSSARLENIEAHSSKGASAINIKSKAIAFKVPIQSFKFSNGLMQEHFNENYMESDKYPEASFGGKILEDIDFTQDGEYKVTATGKLNMHGIIQDRTIAGIMVVKGETIQLNTSFYVLVTDHKIKIPNDKFTNISQNILVKLNAIYEPKK